MSEKIIKSADRVKDIGEVFTPKKTVDFMLDQPEIKAKVNSLTATFLEPSAGEGAFLVELLRRKLVYAKKASKSIAEMQNNFLLALSTLYGIELMEDNVEMLVMNMNNVFRDTYFKAFNPKERNNKILKSAQTIISANMAQGDALTKKTSTGADIVFSEWKSIGKDKVQRTEYSFAAIAKGETASGTVRPHYEQLSLLEPSPDQTESKPLEKHYKLVKWEDIYKQITE
ncbi:DNA methyltransferase [Lactobacillus kefiranofaciens]|uniref:DNA methyltransferase n=1 Tax=Lactobacillus kefiranofaciens TaxID=267818 RepID=UPI001668A85A|nr:DNA methyltransferase [Lactobacillus kefiranofaciens]MCJ2172321.1 DNA methyltransferase [Lactobacillus kefiranofaciens]MCP9330909.1 DNA methyltransferase [Lactobacillus kefiranofaciens]QNT44218.1 DNA methyltransferase [Lactobacillus kefiranofaciens]